MIRLVTDSTAYLPKETIQQHNIEVIPLYVHFGEKAFREGVELSNEEFYQRLHEAPRGSGAHVRRVGQLGAVAVGQPGPVCGHRRSGH